MIVSYEQMANDYRRFNPDRAVGYVIFLDDQCIGWQRFLKPASEQLPGCVAVHHTGLIFQATGGNERRGAKLWELINAWPS